MPFGPFEDFEDCVETIMDDGEDRESAESICGALQAEEKADHGDPAELLEALDRGAGLIADVGVDLVSGVDVPAVDSKWTMLKSADDAHDYRVATPILLSKQDDDDDEDEERRISYAAAMIPREVDKEGDVVATPTVEKAAHDFLTQDGGVDTDHSLIDGDGQVVESWVLKEDRTFDLPDGGTETYGAGTWMVGIKWAAEPWERIKAGELTGLSIYGMAEHVPLSRSCAIGKQLDIPVAGPPEDIHLTYRTERDAERASEVIGLDGATHPHTLDEDTVYMPGGTHQAFVEVLSGGEDGLALSDGKSQDGDTHKGDAEKEGGMGQESDNPDDTEGDDGPTIGEVAASVESLAETVESVTDTVDAVKEAVETDKQDEMEAAATLAEEHGMSPDDVVDLVTLAEGKELEAVLDAVDSVGAEEMENANDDQEEDDEEMEQSAEKRSADANFEKGSDARETAAKGIDTDGDSGSGLSYAELAAEEADY